MDLSKVALMLLGILVALFHSGESLFFKKKVIVHHVHADPHPHPIYYKPWEKKVPWVEEEIYHAPPPTGTTPGGKKGEAPLPMTGFLNHSPYTFPVTSTHSRIAEKRLYHHTQRILNKS